MSHTIETSSSDLTSDSASPPPMKRELCFYTPPTDGCEPRYETEDPSLKGRRNYDHKLVTVDVQDARGHEEDFCLSSHGFKLLPKLDIQHTVVGKAVQLASPYVAAVKTLVASHIPHTLEVIPFDITVREANATGRKQQPVRKVHVDQSERGAYLRAKHELRNRPEMLVNILEHRTRYRIINFWKPIVGPVGDHPIVMADSNTVSNDDVVAVQQVYPHYTGETLAVKYNSAQRYWYWSRMTVGEAILLQIYDSGSKNTNAAKKEGARCVHASFRLSNVADEPMMRQSVEIRFIVLSSA